MKNNVIRVIGLGLPVLLFGVITIGVFQINAIDFSKLNTYPVAIKKEDNKILYKFMQTRPPTWVDLSQISPYAMQAIVISEDWAFFDHEGLDFNQLKIIFMQFIKSLSLHRGGSTITQQVVKNLYLTHEKSLWRKFKEMVISYKLERKFTKNKILEIYLNIIEYGPGIYGIENASLHYFKKPAVQLTLREGAFLAMLLPNPKIYRESFEQKRLTEYAAEKIEDISIKLRQAKFIDEEERVKAMAVKFSWEESGQEIEESTLWE
jgi:monofunctional biosynthetic peptidoglycan transglycosylase